MIKGKHPILKETIELGEDAAYWAEQKAERIATVTKMDWPLKKIDSVAFNGVVKIEDTQANLRNRFQSANKEVRSRIQSTNTEVRSRIQSVDQVVRSRIQSTSDQVHKSTAWVRSKIFGPVHTVLDYVENKFDTVMLKPAEEKQFMKTDPELIKTVGRLFDVTYRFNLGMLNFTAQKAKDLTDRKSWENFYVARVQPHTPGKVRIRQSIIYQEIVKELRRDGAPEEGALSYLENKELLEVDRKIINLGRGAVTRSKSAKTAITQLPSKIWDFGAGSVAYTKDAFGHLSEARSLRDLAGIGMYEVRGVLMGAQDSLDVLRKSNLLDGAISWMASQEKILSNTI